LSCPKKELVQHLARMNKNQKKKGNSQKTLHGNKIKKKSQKTCLLGHQQTHSMGLPTHCGCMSDVACLPVITARVLDNSTNDRERERDEGWNVDGGIVEKEVIF